MRTIAFVGNCQMRGLAAIYQNFAGKRCGDTAHYIRTEGAAQAPSLQRLAEADMVIGQLMEMGSTLAAVASAVRDKKVVHVPHAAGAFLWPQAGEPHATASGRLAPRFGTDYGDRYLNRAIRAGANPAETIRDYVTRDFGAKLHLDRRLEITLARQEERDRQLGYDIAGIVRRHFRDEYLFRSQGHPQLRIMRHLAETLFRTLQVGDDALQCVDENLVESNYPAEPDFAPIHPAVIEHFGLTFVTPDTRFAIWDQLDTFREYAYRYMGLGWNLEIEEGLAAGHRGELPKSEELLLKGLSRSPNSPRAHAALANIFAHSDRSGLSIAHLSEAVRLQPLNARYHHALSQALVAAKQFEAAVAAAIRATELDPASDHFFHWLSDLLVRVDRLSEAIANRERAAALAPLWPHHHRRLGELLKRAGERERGEAALRHATALEAPEQPFTPV
jgi:tetratricopeptide (TPR) repeat protein